MKRTLSLVAAWLLCATHLCAAPLTEGPRLSLVYDAILRADFTLAASRLDAACPPAPAEACQALAAALLWWEIRLDPDDRRLDARLESVSRTAISAAERWTRREPDRAEPWFYLAGAYAPLTEWRILRGERLAAARDALRIRNALERAVALDPSLHDAYFGIGLYHYYADVAPAALKFLRFLLLMPGGDRVRGLREMEQARRQGVLLGGEADFQLHYIYLWYERDSATALALLRGLDARYPSNPVFLQRIAEVESDYRHDTAAARRAWQQLLDRATRGEVAGPGVAGTRARLGLSAALTASGDATAALAAVAPVIDARSQAPYGALAEAHLAAARAHAALGDRTRAFAALDQAAATAPRDDPQSINARARALRSRLRSEKP